MIIFFVVVLSVVGLIHWFLYNRLVSALEITSPAILWPLRILAVFLALSYFAARMVERHGPEPITHTLHWTASVWIGLMWELLWIAFVLYIAKIVLIASGIWFKLDSTTVTLLGRWTAIAAISAAVLLCAYGVKVALSPARIAHVRVPIKNISSEWREVRIAVASDFHAGVIVGRREVERMSDQIMRLKPDLILLPGDIADRASDDIMHFANAFHRLQAPLGVYATTGNHEYYVGLPGALEFLRAAGIRPLMNEVVALPNGLVVAGIEDRTARQFGLPRPTPSELLKGVNSDKPVIFMNHTPETKEVQEAVQAGADLVVSGHTHGGQIWPFSYLSRMAFRYHWGLYKVDKGFIYTSCGFGQWGPPMRIGAPPEIALIRFVGENEAYGVRWE